MPDPLITVSPKRMSGAPVFAGTRVPVRTLFDWLGAGETLDEFVKQFPSVSRVHAEAVLQLASSRVAPAEHSADAH
jgi:uncharacterized protein (DUF433 family)